jgi:superoxide dismutase, Fe-Mn family
MTDSTRRDFLRTTAALSLASTAAAGPRSASAEVRTRGSAFGYQHVPPPLPFDPSALRGLSERLIRSHWENNYGGAVKALNAVRGRLAEAATESTTPPYAYNGLKREQLIRTGSVTLHELYFANLGGDGKPGADLRKTIAASFGTFDAWETEFRRIGQGLAGGSGWVVLGYNHGLRLLENSIMFDHSMGAINTTPMLVMDMYEHAFAIDYGAAAAGYIDAFFANIQWDAVGQRVEGRLAAAGAQDG